MLNNLKDRIAHASKSVLLILRFCTSLILLIAFLQFDGYVMPLTLIGLALACLMVFLCGFRVNGFGLAFGLLVEHFSFAEQGLMLPIRILMLIAAFALFFASLPLPFSKEQTK